MVGNDGEGWGMMRNEDNDSDGLIRLAFDSDGPGFDWYSIRTAQDSIGIRLGGSRNRLRFDWVALASGWHSIRWARDLIGIRLDGP